MNIRQTQEKDKKSGLTPRRVGWLALNVVVPAAEISGVFRYTRRSLTQTWQRLRDITRPREKSDYAPADWSQAVADSGLPDYRLRANYRASRWCWWGLMCVTGLPATGLLLMLLAAGWTLPGMVLLRALVVLLVVSLLSATGFVQALAVTYRLWQLDEKRVSASEKGSFRDFLNETRWCRRVLSAGYSH